MEEGDGRTIHEAVDDIRERFMRADAKDEATVKLIFGEKWLQTIRDTPNPRLRLTRMLQGLVKLGLAEGGWTAARAKCRRTDTLRAIACQDKITAMQSAQAYWIDEIFRETESQKEPSMQIRSLMQVMTEETNYGRTVTYSQLVGVFSSEEQAKEYAEAIGLREDDYCILEGVLDPSPPPPEAMRPNHPEPAVEEVEEEEQDTRMPAEIAHEAAYEAWKQRRAVVQHESNDKHMRAMGITYDDVKALNARYRNWMAAVEIDVSFWEQQNPPPVKPPEAADVQ